MQMKRATFDYQASPAELALTKDPESREWLAVISIHFEERTSPAVLSMAPLDSHLSEAEAWETATQWATEMLPRWWLDLSAPTAPLTRSTQGPRRPDS